MLRSQVFAGDALSHVAFTGALAAAAAGVDIRLGLFVATIAVATGMGLLGGRARPDDVVIGTVFAWVFGLGALFLSIFTAGSSGSNGTAGVRVLFGSILGLGAADARLAAAIAILATLALLAIARPLLFGSVDPEVARGLGIPIRALGLGFFILLAVVAAEATQAVGALLLLGLLAAPGGAARLLTDRPWLGLALSATLALASMWIGLALSYQVASSAPQLGGDRRRSRPLRAGRTDRAAAHQSAGGFSGRRDGAGRIEAPMGKSHTDWASTRCRRWQVPATARAARGEGVVEALARQDCAVTALEIDELLRRHKPPVGASPSTGPSIKLDQLGLVRRVFEVERGTASYERIEPSGHPPPCDLPPLRARRPLRGPQPRAGDRPGVGSGALRGIRARRGAARPLRSLFGLSRLPAGRRHRRRCGGRAGACAVRRHVSAGGEDTDGQDRHGGSLQPSRCHPARAARRQPGPHSGRRGAGGHRGRHALHAHAIRLAQPRRWEFRAEPLHRYSAG